MTSVRVGCLWPWFWFSLNQCSASELLQPILLPVLMSLPINNPALVYPTNRMPLIDPIHLKAKLADFVSGIPTGFHCRLLQQKNSDRKRSATTKIRCSKIKIWQQNCWKIVNAFLMNSEVISFLRLESLQDFRYQNSQRTWLLIFWYKPCLKSSQPYHDHHTYTAR